MLYWASFNVYVRKIFPFHMAHIPHQQLNMLLLFHDIASHRRRGGGVGAGDGGRIRAFSLYYPGVTLFYRYTIFIGLIFVSIDDEALAFPPLSSSFCLDRLGSLSRLFCSESIYCARMAHVGKLNKILPTDSLRTFFMAITRALHMPNIKQIDAPMRRFIFYSSRGSHNHID